MGGEFQVERMVSITVIVQLDNFEATDLYSVPLRVGLS